MGAEIIKGINFRQIEAASPAVEILRDIEIDLEDSSDAGAAAEIFAVVRYADGSYDVWSSATQSILTRVGELETLKHHLLNREDDGT